jgi:hypothetical protein
MRVDEPGHDRAPAKVDAARVGAGEAADIRAGADRCDAVGSNRDGLGDVEDGIESDDIPTVENQVGPGHE